MNINEILKQHEIYITSDRVSGKKADLRGADLRYANLRDADLRYANLRGADLRYADLRYANLRDADLRYANLRGADLCGADLRDADLRYANLRYANLRGADLRYADLRDADLRYANLRDANLRGADLRYADLCGADLPNSTFIITGEEYFISITNGDHLRAGCQPHSINEWFSFSKKEIAEMDGKKALRFYPRLLDIVDFYVPSHGFDRPEWVDGGVNQSE